jgi:hypothetical protein
VREPHEALDEARRAAARSERCSGEADELIESTIDTRRLLEWAIIEPDRARVYSTRRYGKPITLVKRLLVRVLRQYLDEVTAQQSRFNAQVAAHVMRLEERVEVLERERPARDEQAGDP